MSAKMCLTFVAALAIAGCQAAAEPGWEGTYRYEADLGATNPGVVAVVEYTLTLGKGTCALTIQGYQVDESITCKEVTRDNAAAIQFRSYANGEVTNAYGTQVYKPDETLFSLSKSEGEKILTKWAALKPKDDIQPVGEFFHRAQ